MSKWLRILFLVHAVVGLVAGAALLIAPGRILDWLGWRPVDQAITRVFGAALLGLAWSSFRGSRAARWELVRILVETEVAFTVLACVGLLRLLATAHYPLQVWLLFALFLAFAAAWILAWVQHRAR